MSGPELEPRSVRPKSESVHSAVRIRVFGFPSITLDERDIPLSPTRPMQLLAYLAIRGSWQGRGDVAQLFWPEQASKLAYSNLRNLLHKAVAAAPYLPVESTQHALRLNVPSDLDDFNLAIQSKDWHAAVRIGAQELLRGFEAAAPEPYLLWLQSEREAKLEQWKQAVHGLLSDSATSLEQREALAQSWALRCPYDEDAVQARMKLAHERQQAAAATRIYQAFEARLRDELGVKPSVELQRLMKPRAQAVPVPDDEGAAVRVARLTSQAPEPSRVRSAKSDQNTASMQLQIAGRRLELRQLATLLKDDGPQLITLTGPGGVGKSTLLAAFHQQWVEDALQGTFLIDISAATTATAALVAIAAALSVPLPQGTSDEATLATALADALAERPWLLMIDGAEQPGLAAPLAQLLDRCPLTRWVVASRQRLNLDAERLLVLDGFPLPDVDEADPELLAANDGVQFLADVIAKAGQSVNLVRDAKALADLARAVDGLPLALRLLGKLTHLYSLHQLRDSFRQSSGTDGSSVDSVCVGELLPSLLASFQRSWTSLSSTEQDVLARLAVFPTDFEIAAGRRVAKTELPVITSLVDGSLIRADGTGRLSLHAAVRSCVLAIHSQPAADAVPGYLAYYAERLRGAAELAKTQTVKPLQIFRRAEASHLDHAWALAFARRDYVTLLSLQESMWFLDHGGGFASNYSARCIEAERALRDDPGVPASLRAILLAGIAHDALNQRNLPRALDYGLQAIKAARNARHFDATISALKTLIYANAFQRNIRQAESLTAKHEALITRADRGVLSVYLPDYRALIAFLRNDMENCLKYLEQTADVARQIEDPIAELTSLINMAISCHRSGMRDRAIPIEERLIALATQADTEADPPIDALSDFTRWHLHWGNFERAYAYMERANALAGSHPHAQRLRLKIDLARAAVLTAQGSLVAARDLLSELLSVISQKDVHQVADNILVATARWFRLAGDPQACLSTLREVRKKFALSDYAMAQAMLRELGAESIAATPPVDDPVHFREAAALTLTRLRRVLL